MPSTETLEALLVRAKALLGERGLIEALSSLMNPGVSPSEELTIVSNAGMHNIPSAYVHGELYVASDGNLELSSQENISETYASVLQRLAAKLREKAWKKIYLIVYLRSTCCTRAVSILRLGWTTGHIWGYLRGATSWVLLRFSGMCGLNAELLHFPKEKKRILNYEIAGQTHVFFFCN